MKTILIIGTVFPEPASSAAGSRMMVLIDLFRSKNYKIIFASAATDSEFMVDLKEHGVEKKSIELNSRSFDLYVKELSPAIVLFDRFMTEEQFGWRVAEACPEAIRILDTEDLHCLRYARQNAWKEKRVFQLSDLLTEEIAKREIASIHRCDLSLIISEVEMGLLQELFHVDASLLLYLPFMVEEMKEKEVLNLKKFESRKGFVSIGNFLHEPNWNAVKYLKEEIWPLIRKGMPGAELYVYGAYASQKVNELNKPSDGFNVMGRALDAAEVISDARILLAPLRFGAGLKGKLLEAMQYGTPSVTTSIGAEAMQDHLEWNGAIENDPVTFAKAAIELYSDKDQWEQAQRNGISIVNARYSRSHFGKVFFDRLELLQKTLETQRKFNFMGAMLMHHTISGTKYMSKWIEEKNKKE